jgi:hypothetical protein
MSRQVSSAHHYLHFVFLSPPTRGSHPKLHPEGSTHAEKKCSTQMLENEHHFVLSDFFQSFKSIQACNPKHMFFSIELSSSNYLFRQIWSNQHATIPSIQYINTSYAFVSP